MKLPQSANFNLHFSQSNFLGRDEGRAVDNLYSPSLLLLRRNSRKVVGEWIRGSVWHNLIPGNILRRLGCRRSVPIPEIRKGTHIQRCKAPSRVCAQTAPFPFPHNQGTPDSLRELPLGHVPTSPLARKWNPRRSCHRRKLGEILLHQGKTRKGVLGSNAGFQQGSTRDPPLTVIWLRKGGARVLKGKGRTHNIINPNFTVRRNGAHAKSSRKHIRPLKAIRPT